MSLIFQSLQKLKTNLNSSPSGADDAAPSQGPATAKPFLPRLRSTLIGLVAVLVLGCGTVYAVQVLKQRVEGQQIQIAQNQRHAIPYHQASASGAVAEQQHDDALQPAALDPEEKKPPEVLARFYPPEPKQVVAQTPSEDQLPDLSFEPSAKTEITKPGPSGQPEASAPLPMAPKRKPPGVEEQPVYDAAAEAAEKARRAALEKSARIARLVRQIEQAVAGAPSAGNPKVLLDQLAQMKGEEHPYVMKMRAYWNFKKGQYHAAEADLKKVIAVNPDDLEAGINLALIEIQGKRYTEALARLKQLRHTYPDQPMVADLIKRLK